MQNLDEKEYVAGAYTRLSVVESGNGEESISIINQKQYIKEFAEKNGIALYDYYVDDGYSGGNFDRPGFRKMINDIECGVINCVITKDTSRLGRDFIETGNYIYKYFPEHDVRYIAILDNFDTERPSEADDIIPFKTVVNDMYLKETSKKIKTIRHKLMDDGLFVGSSVPYGYKRSDEDNRKLIIDEYAAEVVKRIFEMKLDGETPGMIARALSDEGILTPNVYKERKREETITTNLWKPSTIKHILSNEVYIGTLIQGKYGRVSLKSKKKKLLPKSQWVIKKNNHPAIIDKKIFEKVNAKDNKSCNCDTRNVKYDYLLKGLVVCADCGKTMLVRRVPSRAKNAKGETRSIFCCRTYANYRNHVCSMHYFREDTLNDLVFKEIKRVFTQYSKDNLLNIEYEKTLSNGNVLDKYKKELDEQQEKLKYLDKAISELYSDKNSGIISEDEFVNIKKDLEKEKKNLTHSINDLSKMLGTSKNNLTSNKAKNKMINDFLKLENPTKNILSEIISKITIDKNKKVRIYFNFDINGVV